MNNIFYSFIITFLAGMTTTLGYFAIYIKGNINKVISFFLSFAGGVMISISIFSLIPESFSSFSNYYLFYRILYLLLFLVLGIFISSSIKWVLSKYESNELKKLGILSLISIILHNIPEGIITFMSMQYDMKIGLSLALSIALHNIPEGISIAIPYYYAIHKKLKVFIIVFIAGLSELLGGIITYLFFKSFITPNTFGIMYALIAGIMLNISINDLLKEAFLESPKMAHIGIIVGFIIMLFSIVF